MMNRSKGRTALPVRLYFRVSAIIMMVAILPTFVLPFLAGWFRLGTGTVLQHFLSSLLMFIPAVLLLYFWLIRPMLHLHRAHQEALKSEIGYRSIFDHNPHAICSMTGDGTFLAANQSFINLVGWSEDELRKLAVEDIITQTDVAKVKGFFHQCMGERKDVSYPLTLRHKEGTLIDVIVTYIPVVLEETMAGLHAIVQDITPAKRTEELMRRTENLKSAGQLAAGIAHELRNSITAVKGFIHLLNAEFYGRDEYFRIILDELSHMNSILNEFLSLARPRPKQLQNKNVNELISEIVDLMRTQALLNNTDIQTDLQAGDTLVHCDGVQIKEVLVNILKNAIEAMPDGGVITVSSALSEERVRILVRDAGEGMSYDVLQRIGEPFFTTKDKGTGLGLSICRKIIEEHSGDFHIESELGQGTTVEISFPCSEARVHI